MANFEKQARFIGRRLFDARDSTKEANTKEVTFRNALIEKPENFSLDRVNLRPSWFIDANVRKFRFTNVQWGLPNEPTNGPKGSIKGEIQAIRVRRTKAAAEPKAERDGKEDEDEKDLDRQLIGSYAPNVLAMTCRELTANAEENRDYPTANESHYWAMDALRIGSWSALYRALLKKEVRQRIEKGELQDITRFRDLRFGDLDAKALWNRATWQNFRNRKRERFGLINSLYWLLSGYGVRPLWAFGVLVGMYAVFAVFYMLLPSSPFSVLSTSDVCEYLGCLGQAATYSLSALARLLPTEPKISPGLFQFLVTVEGLLGPLQIALLLLAVRRRVMR